METKSYLRVFMSYRCTLMLHLHCIIVGRSQDYRATEKLSEAHKSSITWSELKYTHWSHPWRFRGKCQSIS